MARNMYTIHSVTSLIVEALYLDLEDLKQSNNTRRAEKASLGLCVLP